MADIKECAVSVFGADFGQGKVRGLRTGDIFGIASFSRSSYAIIDTSLIVIVTSVQVSLGNSVGGSAIDRAAWSEVSNRIARGTGETADSRVGDGDVVQGDIAIIGCHDGVMDDITDMAVTRLSRHLGDGEMRVLDGRRGDIVTRFCGTTSAIIDAGLVEVMTRINIGLNNRMGRRAV